MKLLQQTSYIFLAFSIFILAICGMGLFWGMNYLLDHQMDENLLHTKPVLLEELAQRSHLPTELFIMDEMVIIYPISQLTGRETFADTMLWIEDPDEVEYESYRKYTFEALIHDAPYKISLHHSKFEEEDLLQLIVLFILGFLLIAFLLFNLFNHYFTHRVWQPFFSILDQARRFQVQSQMPLKLPESRISEFQLLGEVLEGMVDKMIRDFVSLKQFTENASHEIQTPLTIIQAQLEIMQQNSPDQATYLEHLAIIRTATQRIGNLNKSLLLLTKIENQQFDSATSIRLDSLIQRKIKQFNPISEARQLNIKTDLQPCTIHASADLLEILISNLVSNAINHNLKKGYVSIILSPETLIIENSGPLNQLTSNEVFERFKKGKHTNSLGLGLAIVRQICERYGWVISYEARQNHRIQLLFT